MSAPRIGVMIPTFRDDPSEAFSVAHDAEALGIDGVFVYDHLWPMGRPDRPALAPFPVLGALAASTSRLWLGTLVARVGLVPEERLVAEFAALAHLAPGRVVAALGTGDHLSFDENAAYGIPVASAEDRRAEVGRCARTLLGLGLTVWVGGTSRATVEEAQSAGVVVNLWQASPEVVAARSARSRVTWAGMARPGGRNEELGAEELEAFAAPLVAAGASWLVFGWPVSLGELAAAARHLRAA